jgi:hypothetical protein
MRSRLGSAFGSVVAGACVNGHLVVAVGSANRLTWSGVPQFEDVVYMVLLGWWCCRAGGWASWNKQHLSQFYHDSGWAAPS